MFVIGLPVCSKCSLGLIQVGVKEVYIPQYKDGVKEHWVEDCKLAEDNLTEAGIKIHIIEGYYV